MTKTSFKNTVVKEIMIYTNPETVTSPRDFVRNLTVLHDGGEESFSLATLEWEGNLTFAIRWNIARREWEDPEKQRDERVCVGMPSSRGHPVWFVLPEDIINFDESIVKKIKKAKEEFSKKNKKK